MAVSAQTSTEPTNHDALMDGEFCRPVDLVHLSRQTLGNRSLECEVLKLFQSQSQLYLQRLKAAGADKDWFEAAHSMKGSARGIGAWQVAKIAERAEGLCGADRERSCGEMVHNLEDLISEVNGFIEVLLQETEPGLDRV